MKKTVALLVLTITISSLVLADKVQSGDFRFNAYYDASSHTNTWLELNISDETGSMMNAAVIQLADPSVSTGQSVGYTGNVFRWELSGNYYQKVTININVLPLQAYKNGIYYIPVHDFVFTLNQTVYSPLLSHPDINVGEQLFDGMYYADKAAWQANTPREGVVTQTIKFEDKDEGKNGVQGNYPYLGYGLSGVTVTYQGSMLRTTHGGAPKAPNPSSDPDYRYAIWTRSGICALKVISHDTTTEGDFDYAANITITVTVNT